MLHLRAQRQYLRILRTRYVELRLRARDIQARGDASVVPLLGQIECVAIGFYRVVENRAVAIEAAQLDVVAREFRQNAILTFRARERVRLRLFRDDWRKALADSDVDFAPPARG